MSELTTNDKLVAMSDDFVKGLEPYCILKGYRGSIAHNTYEEKVTGDDKDIMGILVPPPDIVFGINNMETIERMWEQKLSQKRTVIWDAVYYTVPKFLRLLLKQNPNVIMLLWLSEKHYLKRTKWGRLMIENRDKLLSKQCYQSFCGYAHGQIHRATHPATGKMGAKRKELFAKVGYDSKNLSHCIRLLKMGLETLTTGEMIVERPDNNMLLDIKRGEWEYQKIIDYADKLFQLLDEALVRSSLQERVSHSFVNDMCMQIVRGFYEEGEE